MRLNLWTRKPSTRELAAAERLGYERYKASIDLPRMAQELRDLRNQVDDLEALLSHARVYVLDADLRASIGERIGEDPQRTPIVALANGEFVRAS